MVTPACLISRLACRRARISVITGEPVLLLTRTGSIVAEDSTEHGPECTPWHAQTNRENTRTQRPKIPIDYPAVANVTGAPVTINRAEAKSRLIFDEGHVNVFLIGKKLLQRGLGAAIRT